MSEIEVEEIGIKRILNSWEFVLKCFSDFYDDLLDWAKEKLEKLKNEPKIEFRIEINDETIKFKNPYFYYDFKKKGKNKIKYIFKKLVKIHVVCFTNVSENHQL